MVKHGLRVMSPEERAHWDRAVVDYEFEQDVIELARASRVAERAHTAANATLKVALDAFVEKWHPEEVQKCH